MEICKKLDSIRAAGFPDGEAAIVDSTDPEGVGNRPRRPSSEPSPDCIAVIPEDGRPETATAKGNRTAETRGHDGVNGEPDGYLEQQRTLQDLLLSSPFARDSTEGDQSNRVVVSINSPDVPTEHQNDSAAATEDAKKVAETSPESKSNASVAPADEAWQNGRANSDQPPGQVRLRI